MLIFPSKVDQEYFKKEKRESITEMLTSQSETIPALIVLGEYMAGILLCIATSIYFPDNFYGNEVKGYNWLIGFLIQ